EAGPGSGAASLRPCRPPPPRVLRARTHVRAAWPRTATRRHREGPAHWLRPRQRTRRTPVLRPPSPPQDPQLQRSPPCKGGPGLPDFTGMSIKRASQAAEAARHFLNLIRTTERHVLDIPVASVTRWEAQKPETLPIRMSATVKESAARPPARKGMRARLES